MNQLGITEVKDFIKNYPNEEMKYWLTETKIKKIINDTEKKRFWIENILNDFKKYVNDNAELEQLGNGRFDLRVGNCGYLNEDSIIKILSKMDFAIQMAKLKQ